jgi:hypothetical protein
VLLTSVQLLDEVLCVLDGDLVGVAVEPVHNRDEVAVAAFLPPAVESQVLDVLYTLKGLSAYAS